MGSSGPCQLRLVPQAGPLASGAPRPPQRRGRQSRVAAAHVTVALTRTQCVALTVLSTPTPAACRRPPAAGARGWSPRPLATATSVRTHLRPASEMPPHPGIPYPIFSITHPPPSPPLHCPASLSYSLPSPPLPLPSLPLLSLFPSGHRLAEQPLLPFLVTRAALPPLCVPHPYNSPPTYFFFSLQRPSRISVSGFFPLPHKGVCVSPPPAWQGSIYLSTSPQLSFPLISGPCVSPPVSISVRLASCPPHFSFLVSGSLHLLLSLAKSFSPHPNFVPFCISPSLISVSLHPLS